ncbi:glycosyltransferase [Caldiplasma sukawensis]
MQIWLIISIISLAFTLPVLVNSYYQLILLISAFFYPLNLEAEKPILFDFPTVSILIAVFNEKNVIGDTLDRISKLEYPHDKITVIVADDSNDETLSIVNEHLKKLEELGIKTFHSRRENRENFKSGALNKAMEYVKSDYVLLLDADSKVQEDTLIKGIHAINTHEDTAFVSYRVGHYNRYFNRITQMFALSLDMGDTVNKMGSYRLNLPYSLQGGFTLVKTEDLKDVGLWSENTITEDADLSWKIYLKGKRGIYLSNCRVYSEDPFTLETWKKQTARVQQGWTKLELEKFGETLKAKNIRIRDRIALLIIFMAPFSNISWIITSFLSAFAVIFRIESPANSLFSNPIYVVALALPTGLFYLSGVLALKVQNILSLKDLIMIPVLSYIGACMIMRSAIGFVNGMMKKRGNFFRTPKKGLDNNEALEYHKQLKMDRADILELIFSISGIIVGLSVLFYGVWTLALSMLAFAIFTLKSVNFKRDEKVAVVNKEMLFDE